MKKSLFLLSLLGIIACNSVKDLPQIPSTKDWKTTKIASSPQQMDGDPERGLYYISEGDYLGTGIPYDLFVKRFKPEPDSVIGREGKNGVISHDFTAFQAANGEWVVNGNCFSCHAGEINGEMILGLGNSYGDFRPNLNLGAKLINFGMNLKYKKSAPEYQAYENFGLFLRAMAPDIRTQQPGVNPAARLAEACMQHRDPVDLTYTKDPQFDIRNYNLASDTPPLWHVKKKNALYYTANGRGDFTKLLFQASVLGIMDSTEARKAINGFKDVLAWLRELEPPSYPFEVDEPLAARGEKIFTEHCSGCHGTYGPQETYPNKLVSLEVIKTDPLYAAFASDSKLVNWYNNSWFGTSSPKSWLVVTNGYIAPPLDGIWATAPYLHNGSVPTLEDLLHSPQRPDYWQRSGDSWDYDQEKVGWNYEVRKNSKGKWTFDTALPGYGNQGHTFGDKLSETERKSVIEYLKTI